VLKVLTAHDVNRVLTEC